MPNEEDIQVVMNNSQSKLEVDCCDAEHQNLTEHQNGGGGGKQNSMLLMKQENGQDGGGEAEEEEVRIMSRHALGEELSPVMEAVTPEASSDTAGSVVAVPSSGESAASSSCGGGGGGVGGGGPLSSQPHSAAFNSPLSTTNNSPNDDNDSLPPGDPQQPPAAAAVSGEESTTINNIDDHKEQSACTPCDQDLEESPTAAAPILTQDDTDQQTVVSSENTAGSSSFATAAAATDSSSSSNNSETLPSKTSYCDNSVPPPNPLTQLTASSTTTTTNHSPVEKSSVIVHQSIISDDPQPQQQQQLSTNSESTPQDTHEQMTAGESLKTDDDDEDDEEISSRRGDSNGGGGQQSTTTTTDESNVNPKTTAADIIKRGDLGHGLSKNNAGSGDIILQQQQQQQQDGSAASGYDSSTTCETPPMQPKSHHKSVRVGKEEDRIISEGHLLNQVQKLCRVIDSVLKDAKFEKYISSTLSRKVNEKVFESDFGFTLKLGPSLLEGGGTGVFVAKGTVPKRHLVALYPGCVYKAGDTVLIQSLANPFVFKCVDGTLIDGSNRGLSKMIYSSCSFRDRYGSMMMSDQTWLTASANPNGLSLANPLAVGQFVNNHSEECEANVAYQEADLPLAHFIPQLRRYIPNCLYNSTMVGMDDTEPVLRLVLLCSTREIQAGEELYSSYFTIIT